MKEFIRAGLATNHIEDFSFAQVRGYMVSSENPSVPNNPPLLGRYPCSDPRSVQRSKPKGAIDSGGTS
jgi:hypothetical protein